MLEFVYSKAFISRFESPCSKVISTLSTIRKVYIRDILWMKRKQELVSKRPLSVKCKKNLHWKSCEPRLHEARKRLHDVRKKTRSFLAFTLNFAWNYLCVCKKKEDEKQCFSDIDLKHVLTCELPFFQYCQVILNHKYSFTQYFEISHTQLRDLRVLFFWYFFYWRLWKFRAAKRKKETWLRDF